MQATDSPAFRKSSELVQRTRHPTPAFVQHMGADHRGRHVGVAEQFLHGADVVTALKEMGGKRMAKRVHRDMASDPGLFDRIAQAPL